MTNGGKFARHPVACPLCTVGGRADATILMFVPGGWICRGERSHALHKIEPDEIVRTPPQSVRANTPRVR